MIRKCTVLVVISFPQVSKEIAKKVYKKLLPYLFYTACYKSQDLSPYGDNAPERSIMQLPPAMIPLSPFLSQPKNKIAINHIRSSFRPSAIYPFLFFSIGSLTLTRKGGSRPAVMKRRREGREEIVALIVSHSIPPLSQPKQ